MEKLPFEKPWREESKHHKIARSLRGTHHESNIIILTEVQHRAWHILYKNELPIETLNSNFEMNKSTLIEECRQDIEELLKFWKKEGKDAYNPKSIK